MTAPGVLWKANANAKSQHRDAQMKQKRLRSTSASPDSYRSGAAAEMFARLKTFEIPETKTKALKCLKFNLEM